MTSAFLSPALPWRPNRGNPLVIAASLIAAIRLAKEGLNASDPKTRSIIASSVNFAWVIYALACDHLVDQYQQAPRLLLQLVEIRRKHGRA